MARQYDLFNAPAKPAQATSLNDTDILATLAGCSYTEAVALVSKHGGLSDVVTAAHCNLLPPAMQTKVLALHAAVRALAREEVINRPVLGSWDKLLTYCRVELAHIQHEEFHVLFLDRKNRLIAAEMQQRGTVSHTPVYPRQVAKRALELDASAVIMVHNHPSGDPEPSRADVEMTGQVKIALAVLEIALHDHLIIGLSGHTSFAAQGLL